MRKHHPDSLQLTALRFAAGELGPVDYAAFEARLSQDQSAREALAEAVRLSAAALGQPIPAPEASMRGIIADRLRPYTHALAGFWCRRAYRGHPAAWAGMGAIAAVTVVALGLATGPSAPDTNNLANSRPVCPPPSNPNPNTLASTVPTPTPVAIPKTVAPAELPSPMSSTQGSTAGGAGDIGLPVTPGTTFVPPEKFPILPGGEMGEVRP